MSPELQIILLSALFGLVALAPGRRALGVVGHALLALPMGLLFWSAASLVVHVSGSAYLWRIVLPAAAVSVGLVAFLMWRASDRDGDGRQWGALGALTYLGLLAAVASILEDVGRAAVTLDSWAGYGVQGISLESSGQIDVGMITTRGLFLPSYVAAHQHAGGSWAFVLFPVLGLSILALIAYAVWTTAFTRLRPLNRVIASLAVAVLPLGMVLFWHHSFYVHSNLPSGLYLLMGVLGLARADLAESSGQRRTWLLVSGLSLAGLAWLRPDGLAYAFVPLAVLTVMVLMRRIRPIEQVWVYGPYLAGVAGMLGPLIAVHGMFDVPERLSASASIAIFAVTALLPLLAAGVTHVLPGRTRGRQAWLFAGVIGVDIALILAARYLDPTSFGSMVEAAQTNLFERGSWVDFWYFAFGCIAVAGLLWAAREHSPWSEYTWLAVVQFLTIAVVVHGLAHPGRLGWSDSLNRVLISVVPLVFWLYGGALAAATARVLDRKTPTS